MKKIFIFLFCLFFLFLTNNTFAATFNVSTSVEFQAALTSASGNGQADTINVSAGPFDISPRLLYAPASENFALSIIGAGVGLTVLDGGNTTNILSININLPDHSDANISISGITFQNGNESSDAGGLDINISSADITVEYCEFIDNYNGEDGGGAHLNSFSGTITVLNNIFISNEGGDEGGGLYAGSSDGVITLINNVFQNNNTDQGSYGGGAYVDSYAGTMNVINNTFTGNSSGDEGGGLHVYSNNDEVSTINIYNNIIWGNFSAPLYASSADIFIFDGPNTTSNVYNNDYSAFDRSGDGILNEGANIDQNPLLSSDFHIQADSPALNAGDNNAPFLPSADFEGDDRILDGTVDIGADEYASAIAPTAIPTMNEWGLIVMALLLMGSSFWMIKQRQGNSL